MHLNEITTTIIEPFGDPKDFFWCIELSKQEGANYILISYYCNNKKILDIKIRIIPYYEVVLNITLNISSSIELKDFKEILSSVRIKELDIELTSSGMNISIRNNLKEALKYILMIISEVCGKGRVTYTCNIGDE